MKLSTRGRYGIHAMYDLAAHYGEGPQPLSLIAQRRDISEAYLEQLMGSLRRAGLVTSVRGALGGYSLSRAPEDISVGDVLRALEGQLDLVDCLSDEENCGKSCDCPMRIVWQRMRDGLNDIVNAISLKDMLRDAKAGAHEGDIL